MSEKHLSLEPKHPRKMLDLRKSTPELWYYEEVDGLCFSTGTTLSLLPLRYIRAYLRRLEDADE